MVTGDYQHTGIAVARGVGMLPKADPVIIVQAKSELTVTNYSQGAAVTSNKILYSGLIGSDHQQGPAGPPQLITAPSSESSPGVDSPKSKAHKVAWALPDDTADADVLPSSACELCEGLTFSLDSAEGLTDLEPLQALTTMAQVLGCHLCCNSVLWLPPVVCKMLVLSEPSFHQVPDVWLHKSPDSCVRHALACAASTAVYNVLQAQLHSVIFKGTAVS